MKIKLTHCPQCKEKYSDKKINNFCIKNNLACSFFFETDIIKSLDLYKNGLWHFKYYYNLEQGSIFLSDRPGKLSLNVEPTLDLLMNPERLIKLAEAMQAFQ